MRRFLASFKRGRRERSKNWWEKESLLQINFYTEGREERERKKEKSSLLVPRKKPPPVGGREKEAFLLPVRWGEGCFRSEYEAREKGLLLPLSLSLSRQFFSSLLITDTSFRFRSNEPWSLGEREREREWKSEYSSPWKNILENDRNPPAGCRWYRYTNSIRLENDSQEKGVVKRSIRTNVGLF